MRPMPKDCRRLAMTVGFLACLSLSCSSTAARPGTPRAADRFPAGMLELAVVSQTGETIVVHWQFTNRFDQAVWLPVAWSGGSTSPPKILPLAFVVPPEDLLLVSGLIHPSSFQDSFILHEVWPDVIAMRLAPGESASGRVVIDLPYRIQRTLISPYEFLPYEERKDEDMHVSSGREVRLGLVKNLYMAVECYLRDPMVRIWDIHTHGEWQVFQRSMAFDILEGKIEEGGGLEGVRLEACRFVCVSERIPVGIPFARAVPILDLHLNEAAGKEER
jgi:hypothetical protein